MSGTLARLSRPSLLLFVSAAVVAVASCHTAPGAPLASIRARIATGPLRPNPANPRYFTDGSGKAVYLAGSHTWSNLLDRGTVNPPPPFDYAAYLKWMVSHNFNFMRLWTAELPNSDDTDDPYENFVGLPWKWSRTGPGLANDGAPKFDFNRLDQQYFDRMRGRIILARDNGIYVSIMLFNGFEWQFETNPRDGNPFQSANNVNGVDCPATCPTDKTQISAQAWAYEQAYIRKTVDTVNDLDNVLFEVSNEADTNSTSWQTAVIDFVKQYEATKPKQHPVGMTFQWNGGSDASLYESPADWISPSDPLPVVNRGKVVIEDTDHAFGWTNLRHARATGQRAWVWENFTSGNNVAFMDPYLVVWPVRNAPHGVSSDPHVGVSPDRYWDPIRDAIGSTVIYANRMNLVAMVPRPDLSSTRFCLANPGAEYLVFQPKRWPFSVQLVAGDYSFEWLDVSANRIASSGSLSVSTGSRWFMPPWASGCVLYLRSRGVSAGPSH